MDFEWSEESRTIRELADKILDAEVSEASLREIDQAGSFFHPRAWARLAEVGLLGVAIDSAHGGMGGGIAELCSLLVSVGRHVAPVPAYACLALGALPLSRFGSPDHRRRLLKRVAEGLLFITGAFEESGSRDRKHPAAQAEARGRGLSISGTKICVPLADRATAIVTAATLADGSTVVVLVDPKAQGVELTRNAATHGEPIFRVDLRDVQIPSSDILAQGEAGAVALSWIVNAALACACAMELGVTERALEITARYTSERKQFGVPIGSFQAVRQRAADAYIDVDAIRLSMQQAAYLLDANRDADLACSVAKFQAAECGYRVTFTAQHLHGGMGYDVDYPLHRYYRWSKAIELSLGSASEHLMQIGRILSERGA